MSSSSISEDEKLMKPRVVRRKRKRVAISDEDSSDGKVNLYSHSVLSKVQNVNKEFEGRVKKIDKINAAQDDSDIQRKRVTRSSVYQKKMTYDDEDYVEESDAMDESFNELPEPPKVASSEVKQNTRIRKKINKLKDTLDTLKQQDNINNTTVPETATKSPRYEKTIFVKIRLRGEICKYPLKMSENFEMVLKNIGLRNNISINRVLITKGDTRILPSHTPRILDLNVIDILECVLLDKDPDNEPAKDALKIQMQCSFQRTKISYQIGFNDTLKDVMQKYATHVGNDLDQLVFQFDGDKIKPKDTPESLDMADGDCIDVILKKKK